MNETLAAAYQYVERGWAVIPLHNVVGGMCSCGSADPVHVYKQGGKHPVFREWQRSGLRDRAAVEAMWRERPGANIGIQTGAVSGFWVLDVDPDNGGHTALAGLVTAYGVLPETYTVTTGSGGMHYYWAIPEWEPHAYRGRLPAGLDVRGWGGQVVAPPSVSGKGAYAVGSNSPIVAAPEWLLDMIRPPERKAAAEPEPWAPQLSVGGSGLGGADRTAALVARALPEELTELAEARPGTRNETAFRVASRLHEFINAGWLAHDDTFLQYTTAGALADTDGTFTEAERIQVWLSARRKVAGRAATLDDVGYYGSAVPFGALGVTAAGFSAPGTATVATPTPATGPEIVFVDPANVDGSSSEQVATPVDPQAELRERLISTELGRLWVRDEATKRLRALKARPRNWSAEILDEDGLASVLPPVPLVAEWLFSDSLARINGPSGHGKSFVALELAACVSTGRGWHRKAVQRGRVVYVAAEGASGVRQRLEAWKTHNETERHGLLVLPAPVQVTEAEWDGFVEHMRELRPAMVVLDTQARVTVGVDENSATEMGEFVDGLERLRAATGACVLVVHHRGLRGSDGRGSTAVKGAVTTEMDVSRVGTKITIANRKQKDAAEAESLIASLTVVGESAVLVCAGDPGTLGEGIVFVDPTTRDVSRVRIMALIAVLRDQFAEGNGGTRAEIRTAFYAHPDVAGLATETKRQAWHRAIGRLEELGRIAINPVAGQRFRFAEVDGLDDLDENPDNLSDFGWPIAKKTDDKKKA